MHTIWNKTGLQFRTGKLNRFFIFILMVWMVEPACGQNDPSETNVDFRIDGAQRQQILDGFGVNINTSWWLNGEYQETGILQPAIDLLADSLGATIFRAVIEEMDWEMENDDRDPGHFNWDYYNRVFSTPKFQGIWKTLTYLNQKNIKEGLILSLMGAPPAPAPQKPTNAQQSWMGPDYGVLPSMEDELVESIAALLYYARNQARIQFYLVSPLNETDIVSTTKNDQHPDGIVEGPNIPDPVQYTRIIKKLGKKLDEIGMGDVRFVAPDAAGDQLFAMCMQEMSKDPYVIGKLAHWGVHNYGNNGEQYSALVKQADNPNHSFWVTELAGIDNLLGQMNSGAQGFMYWDGFDCVYQHARRNGYDNLPPNDWVIWYHSDEGKPLIEYISMTRQWKPRQQFYQYAQLYRFVNPGAQKVDTKSENDLFVSSFLNPNGQLVIVGHNTGEQRTITGQLENLPENTTYKSIITTAEDHLVPGPEIIQQGAAIRFNVPRHAVFTLVASTKSTMGKRDIRPEPDDWYAGDMHVHRDCGGPVEEVLPEEQMVKAMEVNNLAVISVLADMGDGEVKFAETDLPKVTGRDAPLSIPGRIVHYDAEWHWDPYGVSFENKALGGHLVLLGLNEAAQIWDESPYNILDYGRKQGAIAGFCHFEYLNDRIQSDLNCCIPIEYPVEAALGTIDFISEDVYSSNNPEVSSGNYDADAVIKAYYKLLNCGFRIALTAGTDYPCNSKEPLGSLLTYVKVDGPLTYQKWIRGIKGGNTVVARNGHHEFIDLKVNYRYGPGDEIKLPGAETVSVEVTWTAIEPLSGTLEIVYNGEVIASREGTSEPGHPVTLKIKREVDQSGWFCARRMASNGHQTHTGAIYASLADSPVRASSSDAQFFVDWLDHLLVKTSPGQAWNQYFTHDLETVQSRYRKARAIFEQIVEEAKALQH